jgi:uncharacterized membrane protein YecN with MAPEG domain
VSVPPIPGKDRRIPQPPNVLKFSHPFAVPTVTLLLSTSRILHRFAVRPPGPLSNGAHVLVVCTLIHLLVLWFVIGSLSQIFNNHPIIPKARKNNIYNSKSWRVPNFLIYNVFHLCKDVCCLLFVVFGLLLFASRCSTAFAFIYTSTNMSRITGSRINLLHRFFSASSKRSAADRLIDFTLKQDVETQHQSFLSCRIDLKKMSFERQRVSSSQMFR